MHDSTENLCFIHLIIAVEGRQSVIPRHFCEALEEAAKSTLERNGNRVYACKHERDHLHALVNHPVELSVDENVQRLQDATQKFVIKEGIGSPDFKWQQDYYAVTCGGNELDEIAQRIDDQQEYHKTVSFKEEFIALLEEAEIDYEPEDLLGFIDLHEE
jgi:putative transposase